MILLTIILICIEMAVSIHGTGEMYVCICNAITDKQIRTAAEAGATDLWGLQEALGVATKCGSCKQTASEILAEYRRLPAAEARPGGEPEVYVPRIA